MDWMQAWELASYVVTTLGLPLAVITFIYQQRRERDNEDEEAYQMLSDAYIDFLKIVLANPDLPLRENHAPEQLSEEQRRRMQTIHQMLISLFERAYLVAWTDEPDGLARDAFHAELLMLLRGEDPAFCRHMLKLADEVRGHPLTS